MDLLRLHQLQTFPQLSIASHVTRTKKKNGWTHFPTEVTQYMSVPQGMSDKLCIHVEPSRNSVESAIYSELERTEKKLVLFD